MATMDALIVRMIMIVRIAMIAMVMVMVKRDITTPVLI